MHPRSGRFGAAALFLLSLPLTLVDSGLGFFSDSDGWQGYEIVFLWPMAALDYHVWWVLPILASNL